MVSAMDSAPAGATMFWGEMTPCDHLVQIYEDNGRFLDTLEGFVTSGLKAGESVIIIATEPHRQGLERRLALRGIDVDGTKQNDQYIAVDAEAAMSSFLEGGWPNDDKFHAMVDGLLTRGRKNNRRVRAFGEMVAVMWARGHAAATVRLEHLWHELCRRENFPLFCAYPKIGFTDYALKSLEEICAAHSRVIR